MRWKSTDRKATRPPSHEWQSPGALVGDRSLQDFGAEFSSENLADRPANSSGVNRTRDLSIMSGALSPSELRCQKRDALVPSVVPNGTPEPGTSSVSDGSARHYESRPALSAHKFPLYRRRDGAQESTGRIRGDSAERSAKVPRCACGETDPRKFGKRTNRGKVGYQHACKPCMVEKHRQWRASPDGRAKMQAGVKASRARYPEKQRARAILNDAIRRGVVHRGPCYDAGPDCRGGIEGHHDDYGKPLEPTWTCRRHHRALDRRRRQLELARRESSKQRSSDFMSLLEFAELVPKGSTANPPVARPPHPLKEQQLRGLR